MADANALLPLSAVALAFACLASVPGALALRTQIRTRAPKDNFYQDDDGQSTPEALAAFSNRAPKTAILLLSTLGFASWAAVSILTTLGSANRALLLEIWLLTASWVCQASLLPLL